MGKLILFKIESGNFANGFAVTVQICEDNPDRITHPFTTIKGKLPPCQPITQHYQQWQNSYRSLHQKVRLGSSPRQITHITHTCQQSASQLKVALSSWYNSPQESFATVREKLSTELNPQDMIRLLVQTDISELRFLPWHLFFDAFLNRYPQAEVAIAPVEYTNINLPPANHSQIKILAVFGNSEGIDLQPDLDAISNLKTAQITTLVTPTSEELFNHLYEQEWDILFFAGHSGTNQETREGKLHLNNSDIITIEDLNKALKKAIAKGLRLAIFNSCEGIGLAEDLANLHLAQIIVMGEMIPDAVAHVFIRQFLQSFANNQPLYLAVRQAREKLQPLEKDYPCATWLPIICQNPASLPLTWQNLQGLQLNPTELNTSNYSQTSTNFSNLLWDTTINQTELVLEYNTIDNINTEVLINYLDRDLSLSEAIATEIVTKGGKTITQQLKQTNVKQLGQIITTNAGNLLVDTIFHAVIYDYAHPQLTDLKLIQTIVHRCLTLADTSAYESIAFPVFLADGISLSVEQIAIVFATEIISYLRVNSDLRQVKLIFINTSNSSQNIFDDRLNRFYLQFKQYSKLDTDLENRHLLLTQLQQIYQQRQMHSSVEILQLYDESLAQMKTEWIKSHLTTDNFNQEEDYQSSIENISQNISSHSTKVVEEDYQDLPQNYHPLAAQIWQELINTEDEDEVFNLMTKLNVDIDGFAWINDQYELAIVSTIAKQKKINEMLQQQIQQLKTGQELLHQKLLELYQQGLLNKKSQGKERNISFRKYPKIKLKVKPQELPTEYRTEKIAYTADKKAIKDAEKLGIDITEIAEIDDNLKIKFGFK